MNPLFSELAEYDGYVSSLGGKAPLGDSLDEACLRLPIQDTASHKIIQFIFKGLLPRRARKCGKHNVRMLLVHRWWWDYRFDGTSHQWWEVCPRRGCGSMNKAKADAFRDYT